MALPRLLMELSLILLLVLSAIPAQRDMLPRDDVVSKGNAILPGSLSDARDTGKISTCIEAVVPEIIPAGDNLSISGLLLSDADGERLGSREIKLFLNNELLDVEVTGEDGYRLGRFEFDIGIARSPGEHRVLVVFSGDEGHDYSQLKTDVMVTRAIADISVDNRHIFIEPDIPVTNSTVRISCALRNRGSLDAECVASLYMDRMDEVGRFANFPSIVPRGGSETITSGWRAVPGYHRIWVSVRSVIPEDGNPHNNLAYRDIYVDPVSNDTWDMFRSDVTRSGFTEGAGPTGNNLVWFQRGINTGSYTAAKSSPAVNGDLVVIGGDTGFVSAFHKYSGRKVWEFETGDSDRGVHSSPAIYDDTVFIGSYDHRVYALDLPTGKKLWSYDTGGWVGSSPVIHDGMLFVGSDVGYRNGQLLALDSDSGTLVWAFNASSDVHSSPAVDPALGIVYVGSNDNYLYALDALGILDGDQGIPEISINGSDLIWNYSTGGAIKASPAVDPSTHIVYVPSWDGNIYAVDGRNGTLLWKRYITPYLYASPAISGDMLVIAGHYQDGSVWALNKHTGEVIWKRSTGGYALSSPTIAGDTVYIGLKYSDIMALDLMDGSIRWYYNNYANVTSSCSVSSGMMYVASDAPEGILYAFGEPRSIIPITRSSLSIIPEHPLARHPVELTLELVNAGSWDCRVSVSVLERTDGARGNDVYEALIRREVHLVPWEDTEAVFELIFDSEGMKELAVELSVVTGSGDPFDVERCFPFGRRLAFSLNVTGDGDADGMSEGWESAHGLDPDVNDGDGDPDGDGLTNLGEYWYNCIPTSADTDGDGLNDWWETDAGSDPRIPDTDGDGITDGWEHHAGSAILVPEEDREFGQDGLSMLDRFLWGCEPGSEDTDHDGMPDAWEIEHAELSGPPFRYSPDPLAGDSLRDPDRDGYDNDGNGMVEAAEEHTNLEEYLFGTRPGEPDSDFDGLPDGEEVFFGDADGDGMYSGWEQMNFLDPLDGGDGLHDCDGDGLTNLLEHGLGTRPCDLDTDGDGLGDGMEVDLGTDPLSADTDEDGIPDGWEHEHGLDPCDPLDSILDADDDGLDNSGEFRNGTDPWKADTDGDGLTDPHDVRPCDFDPRAVLVMDVADTIIGETGEAVPTSPTLVDITMDASSSYDENDNITGYHFDFGDGNESGWTSSSIVDHFYSTSGYYHVGLTVRNDRNITGSLPDIRTIFVSNRPPAMEASLSVSILPTLSPVVVDVSALDDPDGRIESLTVSWDDGNVSRIFPLKAPTGEGNRTSQDEGSSLVQEGFALAYGNYTFSHDYDDDGKYLINVSAVDDRVGESFALLRVTITNRLPTAALRGPLEMAAGAVAVFDASRSRDDDGWIEIYLWEFGDGSTYEGMIINRSFDAAGEMSLILTITDDDGDSGRIRMNLTVLGAAMETGGDGASTGRWIRGAAAITGLLVLVTVLHYFMTRRKRGLAGEKNDDDDNGPRRAEPGRGIGKRRVHRITRMRKLR